MNQYLTTAEVAETLRLSVWQVVNLCRSGKLRATKPSGQWLIRPADLETFIEAGYDHQTKAESPEDAA